MDTGSVEKAPGFGGFILWHRRGIGWVLILITLFMAYWAVHVPIATRFEDLFPANHPNTVLYRQLRQHYGGAQTLVLMLRVKNGDIFNFKTLHDIQDMTNEVNALPGVNHNEVFSLASYRVLYARALPGALVSTPFMFPKVPQNQAELDDLKTIVRTHREQLAAYVTPDLKGALVVASFNDLGVDYKAAFDAVQKLIQKHQDANTVIYASGAMMFAGWGYHYLARIQTIFLIAIALAIIILYLSLGQRSGWWAPLVTGIASAIWGLGFVSLMKFNFDPVMLVIPFVLTARDLSHGIQWHGRYYDELDRIEEKTEACIATANSMLAPGLLAVFANIAGIIFVGVSDVPVLRQIGIGGAVWLGASLALVFVGQPILVSYLARPQKRRSAAAGRQHRPLVDWFARIPVTPGILRTALVAVGVIFIVVGIISARHALIGYQVPGTPIYRADAKINQDTAEIGKFVPTNLGWIVLVTPNYPDPRSSLGVATLRMEDDLATYLLERGNVVAVLPFATIATKPMNMLLHNGHPKYLAMPDSNQLSATLWSFFFGSSAPDEPQSFFAFSPAMTNACIRVLLPDHTYSRLTNLRNDIDTFVRERVATDPQLSQVKILYLGGDAGLYLATDDVISRLNFTNLLLVLAAIFVGCWIVFGSLSAGVLFVVACVMANFGAFVYMNYRSIGLTVDTISVISLSIGLGIDYGIYLVARIRDEASRGLPLETSISSALSSTGVWVLWTFAVMIGGIAPWVFSPLLFQNEMSELLILLMSANVIVGLLILPALIAWWRPRFITRYESSAGGQKTAA
jgi:predicted RND superfamily exporter protein